MDNLTNPMADPVVGDLVRYTQGGFTFEHSYVEPPSADEMAAILGRQWRDNELQNTDQASQTPDFPNRANILLYRSELRSWPESDNFPTTRPVLATD